MAVVRIKRRLNEEPIDTLLLACKRRKTVDDHLTSILKFAGTVSDQEESVSKHISKAIKFSNVKSSLKTPNLTNITDRLRQENKLFSQSSRLKVVNCFRALNELDCEEETGGPSSRDHNLTIVDIESLPLVTEDTSIRPSTEDPDDVSQKYVYDIYYAPDCKLDEQVVDSSISCHVLDTMSMEDCCDDVYNNEEESDDSNDENNWRNDYPDEDPDSIGSNDIKMVFEMGGLNLSETNSLSSDAGEEDLVYGVDDPDFLPEGMNSRYYVPGKDYAAYKKRVAKDLDSDASENSDFFYCDSDQESDKS